MGVTPPRRDFAGVWKIWFVIISVDTDRGLSMLSVLQCSGFTPSAWWKLRASKPAATLERLGWDEIDVSCLGDFLSNPAYNFFLQAGRRKLPLFLESPLSLYISSLLCTLKLENFLLCLCFVNWVNCYWAGCVIWLKTARRMLCSLCYLLEKSLWTIIILCTVTCLDPLAYWHFREDQGTTEPPILFEIYVTYIYGGLLI